MLPTTVVFLIAMHNCFAALNYFTLNNASDYCMDGMYHKEKPGPEAELFQQCTPWKKRSCCTHNTTKSVHDMNMYNFNYDHCSAIKPLSEKCKKHFIQDACFFECSPNLGPWVVQVKMKTRNETMYKVPLCQSECDRWFEDCKEDYTCAKNWIGGFQWTDTNSCKPNATCIPFHQMYDNSKDFCESIWNDSWEYTPDDKPCMLMWFNSSSEENPNNLVAAFKVEEDLKHPQKINNAFAQKSQWIFVFLAVAILF